VQFNAIPSTVPYIVSDDFVDLIAGPVGSTKTTASIIKIAREAKRVHPCADGVRRSRVAVVRNTRQMLLDTTIPDFLKWFPDGEAGLYEKTQLKFTLMLDDVQCEVLFRGLDDANDVRRLLSLQLSFAMMDEFREINPDVFNMLTTRLGRYPDKTMNGVGCAELIPTPPPPRAAPVPTDPATAAHDAFTPLPPTVHLLKKIWGASNPPDADTFWESLLSSPPKNTHITIQPSGLAPEADWLQCLDPDYYPNIMEGKTEEWIDVYVHAKFGRSLAGRPVWRAFSSATHVAKEALNPLPSSTLVIGMDAGLNPTAVLTQLTYDGRVLVLDAITGHADGMGALRFSRERLKPLLSRKYPRHAAVLIIDPAAFQRAQTDERTVADIFKNEGFKVVAARTFTPSARIAAVDSYLTRTVDGKAAFLMDPGCKELITAIRSKYRYKTSLKGETADTPEKNHPWSDYGDALGYACLQHDGGKATGGRPPTQARVIKPAPFKWAA
jgi:hypothetical protein